MIGITGEQVRDAMIAANINYVDHHECGICGCMTYYSREADQLFFNSGCDCHWSPAQPRKWDNAANWINMQTGDCKTKLMQRFGIQS